MAVENTFMGKVFVGSPAPLGTWKDKVEHVLMEGETSEMEYKGLRDGMVLTDRRMIVINAQGITGKKLEFSSFPWTSVSAYAVENSGTFDLDAELKICGSGWGVCEVQLSKGSKLVELCRFINGRIFR